MNVKLFFLTGTLLLNPIACDKGPSRNQLKPKQDVLVDTLNQRDEKRLKRAIYLALRLAPSELSFVIKQRDLQDTSCALRYTARIKSFEETTKTKNMSIVSTLCELSKGLKNKSLSEEEGFLLELTDALILSYEGLALAYEHFNQADLEEANEVYNLANFLNLLAARHFGRFYESWSYGEKVEGWKIEDYKRDRDKLLELSEKLGKLMPSQ